MTKYKVNKKYRGYPRRLFYIVAIVALIFVVGSVIVHKLYNQKLRPVSGSAITQIFNVDSGSSVKLISNNLQNQHLVRSSWATQLYIHSENLSDKLQAGTYALSPDESTQQIIANITQGKVATNLVTILPGVRIDQIRKDLINDGYKPNEVDNALNPKNYLSVPVMSFVPPGTKTLEGMLWPDSYQKSSSTSLNEIIIESLNEMGKHLTPSVQTAFANEGLTTYQGITLTSIVNQEVNKPSDQAQVTQVFLSRLKIGIQLGSDVTANYGAIVAGQSPKLTYDSPYNTRIHTGLPPTPISTISASSLYATTHPTQTNWLYFVTGDDGTTYFSTTSAQHDQNTTQYCHKLCALP